MKRPAAVLIGGPPATGKSTLAAALAHELGAALLDLDVATGPLTQVVSDLIGARGTRRIPRWRPSSPPGGD